MASLIGALRVTLGIDTAAFSTGMAKAESTAKRSVAGIRSAIGGLAAGVGLAALTALASRSLDYASSLGEVAQQLGVTTKELQEYRYVASQVGIEQDTMDKSLAKLTRTIGQAATGGAAQKRVFDALGISVVDLNGKVRTAGDVLPEIADALAKIPDPARRAAVETQLFGRAGQQLDTMLAGGSQAMNELRDAAHSLGIVLSEDEIQRADETADKLAEVKQVLEAKIAGTVANNAQAIVGLASALASLTGSVVNFLGSNPGRAIQLMSAMGGAYAGARFGPVGAIAGGVGGMAAGAALRTGADDANMNLAFRRQRHQAAREQYDRAKRSSGGAKAFMAPHERALRRETELLRKATAGVRGGGTVAPALGPGPDIDLSGGDSGGGGGGRKGGAKGSNDAIRDRQRIEDATRDLQIDELRARQDLVYDIKGRGVLSQKILELEQAGERAQIEHQVELKDMTRAEADKQLASLATVHALQREKLVRDEQYDILQEQYRQEDAIAGLGEDRLRLEADLARTARERREIENRILDHKLQEERNAAQRVLDDPRASPEEKTVADRRLLWLDQNEGALRNQVNRQNMSPLEAFFDKLPKSAADANEALEEVAAGGLGSIIDGLADAATGARSLGDVFKSVARQIIADLIRIQIQKAIVSGLSSVLGGLGGGGAKIGAVDTSGAFAAPSLNFARGGAFRVSGRPGVDTNILSINGHPSARVSAGEHVAVIPNNKGGGRGSSLSFDLRGAVMTQDLVAQMQQIAVATGGAAAMAGGQLGEGRVFSRGRRTLR